MSDPVWIEPENNGESPVLKMTAVGDGGASGELHLFAVDRKSRDVFAEHDEKLLGSGWKLLSTDGMKPNGAPIRLYQKNGLLRVVMEQPVLGAELSSIAIFEASLNGRPIR